jgi:hypothetical protein
MHAATCDTQPRPASTRQLISKELHIKNHIIDLDIEHRAREREREREREFPFNWKGCARGTWSWHMSIANYMIMCLDFRFQHRIIFKVAAVLLLCNLISRLRKICALQICKEYLDSKLIREIIFCLLFVQYLIDFKTQKDFVFLQICKEILCGLKNHPQIFYLLLCNTWFQDSERFVLCRHAKNTQDSKLIQCFFTSKFCYLISRGRKICAYFCNLLLCNTWFQESERFLCFADMQGTPCTQN